MIANFINMSPLFVNEEKEMNSDKIDEEIINIFNYKSFPFEEEDNINDYSYLFLDKRCSAPTKTNLFIENENTKHKTQLTKKKRGKPATLNRNNTKTHDKFSIDNLLAKIKNHSLSCVVSFLNDILKALSIEEEFCKLSYQFKKNVKKQSFSEAKKKTLGEIICNIISPKYKLDKNENIRLYNKYKDHEVLKKIFSMDYVTFFKRYYLESKKCINLKEFDLDKEIVLSEKCKMFNDLIDRIKNSDDDSNNDDVENYIKSIKKCIDNKYSMKKLFMTYK